MKFIKNFWPILLCFFTASVLADAQLTLVKEVVNDNGGKAKETDFILTATKYSPFHPFKPVVKSNEPSGKLLTSAIGSGPYSGTVGEPEITNVSVKPGTYTLSESGLAGYTGGSWVCDGGSLKTSSSDSGITTYRIKLKTGESATCTIINNDQPAQLTLQNTVDNDNGGSAVDTDFILTAAGPSTQTGVEGSAAITDALVDAGTYILSESGPAGYTGGNWSCTAGTLSGNELTLAVGENATCTIINTDNPIHLTLQNTVINDNGGSAVDTDFTLTADGPSTQTGAEGSAAITDALVDPGTYTLSESGLAGYSSGNWSCTAGSLSGNELTLALGENAICTIINTDNPVHLTLQNTVINDNGGSAVDTDFTLSAVGPSTQTGVEGSAAITNALVHAGTYTLSESGPAGYTGGNWSCTGGTLSGNKLTLALGESATCTIINNDDKPSYTMEKKADKASISAPGIITYTFTFKNIGTTELTNLTIIDSRIDSGSLTGCPIIELAPGATKTCSAIRTISQAQIDAGTDLTNKATPSVKAPDGKTAVKEDNSLDDNWTVTKVNQVASISFEKTASATTTAQGVNPNIVDPGDSITYKLLSKNNGNVSLHNVLISDPLLTVIAENCSLTSNGDTFLNDGNDTLDVGESVACIAVYTLTQSDIDAGKRENKAAVNAQDPSNNPVSASHAVTSSLAQKTSLELLKTAGVPTKKYGVNPYNVDAGDKVSYIFDIKNTGNVTLSNVTVTDLSLGGAPFNMLVDCGAGVNSIKTLVANATHQCAASYTLTQDDIDGLSAPTITNIGGKIELVNTAKVIGVPPANSGLSKPIAKSSSTADAQLTAAIALVKSAGTIVDVDKNGVNSVGDKITYTYVVTNKGTTTLKNVKVTEESMHFTGTGDLPIPSNEVSTNTSGLSTDTVANNGAWDSLAPGDVVTFSAIYTLTQADIDAGSVENEAEATATPPAGLDAPKAGSSVNKPIIQLPAITLVKVMSNNDDEDGSHSITLGDTLTYKITATNNGNMTLNNVAVSDNKISPSTASCATLQLAESCELIGVYQVTQADVDAGKIDNTASVTTPDVVAIADVNIVIPVVSQKSFSLKKTMMSYEDKDNSNSITVGDILTYEIVATNTGTASLTKLLVTDPLITPNSKTCAIVAPGTSCTLSGVYVVTEADAKAGTRENTASANSDQLSAITANTSVAIKKLQTGSIKIIKTGYAGHSATPGSGCGTATATAPVTLVDIDGSKDEPVTYCFEVTNTAVDNYLTDIQVTDLTLGKSHAALTLLNGPAPVALEPGATLLYFVEAIADKSYTNKVNVVATPSDAMGNPTGLVASVSGTDSTDVALVVDPPSANKTVTASGETGMEWQMVWINSSTVAAPDVFVFDEVPEGTRFEAMPAGDFVSASGVYCEARGASTTKVTHDANCYFEAPSGAYPRGRVIWNGVIASDAGNTTEATANNEVVIRFVTVLDEPTLPNQEIKNQGHSQWDYDHDGNFDIEALTDNPDTDDNGDNTTFKPASAIPTLSEWMLVLLSLLLFIYTKSQRKRHIK